MRGSGNVAAEGAAFRSGGQPRSRPCIGALVPGAVRPCRGAGAAVFAPLAFIPEIHSLIEGGTVVMVSRVTDVLHGSRHDP